MCTNKIKINLLFNKNTFYFLRIYLILYFIHGNLYEAMPINMNSLTRIVYAWTNNHGILTSIQHFD
jgi:hypothetical protein